MKKLVVEVEEDIVKLEDVDWDNIYAFISVGGTIYKAQKIEMTGVGKKQWAFVPLDSTRDYSDDMSYPTLEELLEPYVNAIYEFNDQKEFLEWSLTMINKWAGEVFIEEDNK